MFTNNKNVAVTKSCDTNLRVNVYFLLMSVGYFKLNKSNYQLLENNKQHNNYDFSFL